MQRHAAWAVQWAVKLGTHQQILTQLPSTVKNKNIPFLPPLFAVLLVEAADEVDEFNDPKLGRFSPFGR